jgi:hypothetical protein
MLVQNLNKNAVNPYVIGKCVEIQMLGKDSRKHQKSNYDEINLGNAL